MPLHIEQAREAMATHAPLASLAVGDARQVDLPDGSAGALLLLGPLYHLTAAADRAGALREAYRLLQPGGTLCAAAISRYASTLDGLDRGYWDDPAYREIARADLATGQHRNPTGQRGYFTTAYLHRPEELLDEVRAAGFADARLFAIEGPLWLTRATRERWDDPVRREHYLDAVRLLERDMALMAVSSHILAVGTKPER